MGTDDMTDTQAMAARLTAIAERRRRAVAGDPYPFADIDTLSAYVETLEREKAELRQDSERHERMYLAAHADWEQA